MTRSIRRSPLLLAVLLGCYHATTALSSQEREDLQRRQRLGSEPPPHVIDRDIVSDSRATRPDVGTKDAPVDGLDGKPHAGPFVDPHPTDQRESGGEADTLRGLDDAGERTPEDGVMNDPNRSPPKKGTTGTEGGVSEKERDRKYRESSTGERVANVPDQPKISGSGVLDHSDHVVDLRSDSPSRDVENTMDDKDANTAKGLGGLEVSQDLYATV